MNLKDLKTQKNIYILKNIITSLFLWIIFFICVFYFVVPESKEPLILNNKILVSVFFSAFIVSLMMFLGPRIQNDNSSMGLFFIYKKKFLSDVLQLQNKLFDELMASNNSFWDALSFLLMGKFSCIVDYYDPHYYVHYTLSDDEINLKIQEFQKEIDELDKYIEMYPNDIEFLIIKEDLVYEIKMLEHSKYKNSMLDKISELTRINNRTNEQEEELKNLKNEFNEILANPPVHETSNFIREENISEEVLNTATITTAATFGKFKNIFFKKAVPEFVELATSQFAGSITKIFLKQDIKSKIVILGKYPCLFKAEKNNITKHLSRLKLHDAIEDNYEIYTSSGDDLDKIIVPEFLDLLNELYGLYTFVFTDNAIYIINPLLSNLLPPKEFEWCSSMDEFMVSAKSSLKKIIESKDLNDLVLVERIADIFNRV